MRKLTTIILLCCVLQHLYSCRSYRYVYAPTPSNNPYFREKGESKISFLYSGSGGNQGRGMSETNEGVDLQGAYAISNHVAVTGSYFYRKERDVYLQSMYINEPFDSSVVKYRRRMFEGGIGYFTTVDASKRATFSIYAGFGAGKFTTRDDGHVEDTITGPFLPYSRFLTTRVQRLYIQPGLNFWSRRSFATGFSLRASRLSYLDTRMDYTEAEKSFYKLDRLGRNSIFCLEPNWSLQFGHRALPWIKAEVIGGFIINWPTNHPATRGITGSIGVTVDLSKIKRR